MDSLRSGAVESVRHAQRKGLAKALFNAIGRFHSHNEQSLGPSNRQPMKASRVLSFELRHITTSLKVKLKVNAAITEPVPKYVDSLQRLLWALVHELRLEVEAIEEGRGQFHRIHTSRKVQRANRERGKGPDLVPIATLESHLDVVDADMRSVVPEKNWPGALRYVVSADTEHHFLAVERALLCENPDHCTYQRCQRVA